MTSEKMISKITKLLNLAERTENEHEADAFLAKAQSLMVQNAIDEAAIASAKDSYQQTREQILTKIVLIKRNIPRTKPQRYFLSRLSLSFNCQMWYNTYTDNNYVCGHESDVDFVRMMFASIILQQHSAMLRARKEHKNDPGYKDWVFRSNFISGYLERVAMRIEMRNLKVDETHGAGTELVLRSRKAEVDDWIEGQGFSFKAARSSRSTYDHNAYSAGRSAGDRADISGGRGTVRDRRAIGS